MAVLIQKPHALLHTPIPITPTKPRLRIKCQDSSEPQKPSTSAQPTSPGQGFGSASSSVKTAVKKKNEKGRRERASIIRRSPVQKPEFLGVEEKGESKEQSRNESAFLLAWLGLGGIILVEGIILAASGFLPEEWDKFFVKYLYPSFTPTVFLFVAGTVAYGVLKYLQNEEIKTPK
ncbi:hypothetical protein PVL29_021107 [Vitis rotundifolia]|uniref:Protein LOW PSII ACCUMULATION 2, chloroplastic n=1 Tax=Vitis rotundifolia TaxID=103349 RepID=A0AA39DCY5_VITRO|nr:hypothetical protein PVL29_021107 [Vitis rotundifolia]